MAKRKNTRKHAARATARQLRIDRLKAEEHPVKGTPPAAYIEARDALVGVKPKRKRWSFQGHMKLTNKSTWVTADGMQIPVKGMKPGHLVNTVRMLRRTAPAAKLVELLQFLHGPRPSGDMATDGFNDAIEEMANESPEEFLARSCPPYRAMLARYDACVEELEEAHRAWLDEELSDPWGNS